MSPRYQDIIPPNQPNPERRSIRDIPLPERKQKGTAAHQPIEHAEEEAQKAHHHAKKGPTRHYHPEVDETTAIPVHAEGEEPEVEPAFYQGDSSSFGRPKKRSATKWVVGIVVVLLLGFFIGNMFTHATILVQGKNEQIALNGATFALASAPTQAGIVYDIITISAESTTTASPSEKISNTTTTAASSSASKAPTSSSAKPDLSLTTANGTRATGKVIIYNNYNASAQDLVEGTRLETSDGLVYRITQPVSVPGQKTSGGKTVPGSVTVTVVSDEVGEKYNSGPKDFTIPGFKGTPQYTGFYARSSGSLTGGSTAAAGQGTVSTSATGNGTVEDRLREDLKNQLANQITAQLPENFVYLPESMIISYSAPSSSAVSGGQMTVTERATATAVIVDKASLVKNILAANITTAGAASTTKEEISYDGDFSKLTVSFPSGTTAAALKSGSAKILLTGSALIKPVFNGNAIARAVSTLSQEQAKAVILGMDNVETVDISLTPFWKKNLPRADKITIK